MNMDSINFININRNQSENIRYNFNDLPFYFHKGHFSMYPNYSMQEHWHDDIELILILSGNMTYNINGKLIKFNEGEGIIINSHQLHAAFSSPMQECEYIVILFHPMILCSIKQYEQEFVLPFINSSHDFIHLKPSVDWQSEIIRLINCIAEKIHNKTSAFTTIGILHLIWSEIIEHINIEPQSKVSNLQLSTLKNMISFIHSHYSEKITLADISQAGHISKRTCGNLFFTYLYKTPIEFLNDYRFKKSIELMQNTDMTILEIALACGFSGSSYYAETFRKRFGKSPTEYKRKKSKNLFS